MFPGLAGIAAPETGVDPREFRLPQHRETNGKPWQPTVRIIRTIRDSSKNSCRACGRRTRTTGSARPVCSEAEGHWCPDRHHESTCPGLDPCGLCFGVGIIRHGACYEWGYGGVLKGFRDVPATDAASLSSHRWPTRRFPGTRTDSSPAAKPRLVMSVRGCGAHTVKAAGERTKDFAGQARARPAPAFPPGEPAGAPAGRGGRAGGQPEVEPGRDAPRLRGRVRDGGDGGLPVRVRSHRPGGRRPPLRRGVRGVPRGREVRAFLEEHNPAALRGVAERLTEALDRRLWRPRSNPVHVALADTAEEQALTAAVKRGGLAVDSPAFGSHDQGVEEIQAATGPLLP